MDTWLLIANSREELAPSPRCYRHSNIWDHLQVKGLCPEGGLHSDELIGGGRWELGMPARRGGMVIFCASCSLKRIPCWLLFQVFSCSFSVSIISLKQWHSLELANKWSRTRQCQLFHSACEVVLWEFTDLNGTVEKMQAPRRNSLQRRGELVFIAARKGVLCYVNQQS